MTTTSAWSVALIGMEGALIEVEAALGAGLPRTVLVGLPDTALYEARDRCRAAMTSVGLSWPNQLLTINLTPASLPKAGSHYDLAILAAVLSCSGIVPPDACSDIVLMGEVGLDGRVRPVSGVLPAMIAACRAGRTRAIVPAAQVGEASLIEGLTVWGVADLAELIEVLHGRPVLGDARRVVADEPAASAPEPDLADLVGQPEARWALEVAAAGGHHVFFHGPPGVGKTMLAERLPGLLPDLDDAAALEVSAVHSLLGDDLSGGLVRRPPFASPHHNATVAALVGGGSRVARPGEISRAHRGVLFLDEAPEFPAAVLEALRTPLESGVVTISRAHATARYPARFQLVLAANPCPCGMAATPGSACRCTPMAIRRYHDRLSGPVLDRIDIHQHLMPVRRSLLLASSDRPEGSAVVADRVAEARVRAANRLVGLGFKTNAEVPGPTLRTELPKPDGAELLDAALLRGKLSARGVDKVLRVAWTLTDLAGRDQIGRDELHAALALRAGDWSGVAA